MTLAETLRHLLYRWWQDDRVRVSPDQGRLLRLQPPCFLRIAGGPWLTVQTRQTIVPTPARVPAHAPLPLCGAVYHCTGDGGGGTLRVASVALHQPPLVFWRPCGEGQTEQMLSAAAIQVFQSC